jgi:hypothetical protein
MRLGGVCAFVFVVLFTISIAAYWITGGLEFRAWVPLFSSLVCFWLVATIAVYDYLTKAEYALARVGFGFAIISVVILFLEAAVWGADQMILRTSTPEQQPALTQLGALFTSLHLMVLWSIAIWYALWGVGFLRLAGKAKFAGTAMILVAGFHMGDYLLYRAGEMGQFAEFWHLGSQGFNLIAYSLLGLLLLEASRAKAS